jgi:tight adherence protein B
VEFGAVMALLLVAGTGATYALFGGVVPALIVGLAAAASPVQLYRARRAARLEVAQQAWPRLIEEVRLRATTLGRSLPQALCDVGDRAPAELQPAFAAAQREWLLSVDFARTLDVLKDRLADATADATCETLLVAHEVGGTDLGPRLQALAADRHADAEARKEARARQSGVRLARRFVLVVPAGMAVAGSLIGEGRGAYSGGIGQAGVVVALAMVAGCWVWAGRYLRLPTDHRIFEVRSVEAPVVVGGRATHVDEVAA